MLINTSRSFDELGLGEFVDGFRDERLLTVPASELAREHLGRPLPNAALLGGFAALTGVVSIDSVAAAIRERFSGPMADAQRRRGRAPAFDYVADASAGSRPMLRQIEGSRAVAEAVAMCRPEVDLRLPDLAPDPHRRGPVGDS